MNFITPRFDEPPALPGSRSANLDMTNHRARRSSAGPATSTASSRWRLTFCLFHHEAVLDEPRQRVERLLGLLAASFEPQLSARLGAEGEHMHDALAVSANALANDFNLARKLHRQPHELLSRPNVQAQRVLVANDDDALCRGR
jgi:hypothetical protein